MLSTCQAFGLFSRAVSRKGTLLNITEWIHPCNCSTKIPNGCLHLRTFLEQDQKLVSENKDLEKHCFWSCKEETGKQYKWQCCLKKVPEKHFQQNSKSILPKDLQFKTENIGHWHEYQCIHKGQGNISEKGVTAKLNVDSSSGLLPAKLKTTSKMRPPFGMNHLRRTHVNYKLSVNYHGRHFHTLLNIKDRKKYDLGHTLPSCDVIDTKMVRYKSSHSFFKKLVVKLFKEKDLAAKVEVLKKMEAERLKEAQAKSTDLEKDAQKSQKENITKSVDIKKPVSVKSKEDLSNLIYGCVSSKHLLDLIVPWIENNAVSVDDSVKAIEHLQSLVYGEIMKLYPDLPYGSVSVMYENLKLLHVEAKVFSAVHSHITFQTLIHYLEQNAGSLTKSQYVSCFSCLTHLDVSHFDPIMTKFYLRMMNGDEKDYTLLDIVNLYNVSRYHGHTDLIVASYVIPKLSKCLRVFDSKSVDIDTFRALVYVAETISPGLKESDTVTLYSHIYKASMETDCLNDLNCACELVSHLSRKFYVQKQLAEVSLVYYQIIEAHKENVIQIMSDVCLQKIEKRTKELSPLKIKKLKEVSGDSLYKTRLYAGISAQVEYFLKKRITELSLPELIWVLVFSVEGKCNLSPEVKTAMSEKFERLDLPNLYQVFSCVKYANISDRDHVSLIVDKTLKHMNEIALNEQIFHKTMTFYWGLWFRTKHKKSLGRDTELAFQKAFLEIYQNNYVGLKTSFASSVLMTLPRFWSLQLPSLLMLSKFSVSDAAFQTMSQGNLFVILDSLCSKKFDDPDIDGTFLHDGNRSLYEATMFRLLCKSVVEFNRTMNQDVFIPHVFIRTVKLLMSNNKIDFLLQSKACEKISKSPLVRMQDILEICKGKKISGLLKIDSSLRETFLHNFIKFALENKDLFTYKGWRMAVRFLLECRYKVSDNTELQNLLQTVVYQRFSLGSQFCHFVSHCSRLGVDMSKALKIIFSVEYLKTTDQLIADKILNENEMKAALFKLNQIVCISYPALNVPWFQEQEDVIRICAQQTNEWKYIPKDFSNAVTEVAGGKRFVGKEIFLDYGIPAWRVLLIDQQNKPVEFTTRNLKMADEMNCKRLIIWYLFGAFDIQNELLKQAGYRSVVIHRSEWNSIGLGKYDDKLQFLRDKLFQHKDDIEVYEPPTVNCKQVSSQWRNFLESKG